MNHPRHLTLERITHILETRAQGHSISRTALLTQVSDSTVKRHTRSEVAQRPRGDRLERYGQILDMLKALGELSALSLESRLKFSSAYIDQLLRGLFRNGQISRRVQPSSCGRYLYKIVPEAKMARGHTLIREKIEELRTARAAGATILELQAETGFAVRTINTYTKGLHVSEAKKREERLLELLREYGSLCRKELVEHLGSNANSINNVILRLRREGAVERFKLFFAGSGRPVYFYRLTKNELEVQYG